ncbi:hypothetical protein EZS27_005865 [termite gut metagenome]|uniref:Uncharacterized protein n=1 Tax=termite gut metagenome TaxID=433724 RepID=A0A5J4SMZ8_9ZZZZ
MDTLSNVIGKQLAHPANKKESIETKSVNKERLITDEDLKNGITGEQLKEEVTKRIEAFWKK